MASVLSSDQLVGETLCYMNYADKEIFDELCLRAKLGGLGHVWDRGATAMSLLDLSRFHSLELSFIIRGGATQLSQ